MKRFVLMVIALAALCSMRTWADDKVAEEDKKFEGIWVVTAMEFDGKPVPDEFFGKMTFTFKGKNYEQKDGDKLVEAGKQDLDPKKNPKHMDISVTEGNMKGSKQLAIYEIDGDKLKICASAHDNPERPAKFETKENTKSMIFELKRKKD